MAKLINPFPVLGYHGPDLFCDRQAEVKRLKSNIDNGINTTLVSIRRLGKTGLLQHLFNQLGKKKERYCLYVDIYPTLNQKDLINELATAILNAFPPKKTIGKKVMQFVASLRPVISYDPLTGKPEVSLNFSQSRQGEQSLGSLLSFLDSLGATIVIAMDEFQQITQYPETNTEAMLRTLIQPLKNVRFIYSGSSNHLLSQMFTGNKRPFYGSAQMMELHPINKKTYSSFIKDKFQVHRRTMTNEALDMICDWTRLHTYYTQVLCNRLFAEGFQKIAKENVQETCIQILEEHKGAFFQYRNLLTASQWQLLRAIAKEGGVNKPTSKDFISKYRLGTPSNIQRSLDALMTKEMIYKEEYKKGSRYIVYDCFLSRWLERS